MNKNEYKSLSKVKKTAPTPISAKDLNPNMKDRTLLFGTTISGKVVHVYLKDEVINTIMYDVNSFEEIEIKENKDYVPKGTSFFPECCDYLFCKLLMLEDVSVPFLLWYDKKEEKDFYGKIKENF